MVIGPPEVPTMRSYPAEFRHRVVALTDDGMTTAEIAEVLGVSGAWVRSVKALHRSGASFEPKSRANHRTSLAEREGDRIRAQVRAKPGTTLEDLRRDPGLETSIPNLWLALQELRISRKKNAPRGRTGPPRCRRDPGRRYGSPACPPAPKHTCTHKQPDPEIQPPPRSRFTRVIAGHSDPPCAAPQLAHAARVLPLASILPT